MSYSVQISDAARKSLKNIDRFQAQIILSWIEKNLEGCENPRAYGKALVGTKKDYWRYRVGNYRIISEIQDQIVKIDIINIGHRKEAYK